mmetsp:Transcript_30211/g.48784  ORF Transcript_30211/g.48784 Transcript_30211/m.48784 type:complete len:203 (+) Transcript_30211:1856-2464(+)
MGAADGGRDGRLGVGGGELGNENRLGERWGVPSPVMDMEGGTMRRDGATEVWGADDPFAEERSALRRATSRSSAWMESSRLFNKAVVCSRSLCIRFRRSSERFEVRSVRSSTSFSHSNCFWVSCRFSSLSLSKAAASSCLKELISSLLSSTVFLSMSALSRNDRSSASRFHTSSFNSLMASSFLESASTDSLRTLSTCMSFS